jgi:hypothetical protein
MASAIPSSIQTPWTGTPQGVALRHHLGNVIGDVFKAHSARAEATVLCLNISGVTLSANGKGVASKGAAALIGPLTTSTADDRAKLVEMLKTNYDTLAARLSTATKNDIILLIQVEINKVVHATLFGLKTNGNK